MTALFLRRHTFPLSEASNHKVHIVNLQRSLSSNTAQNRVQRFGNVTTVR